MVAQTIAKLYSLIHQMQVESHKEPSTHTKKRGTCKTHFNEANKENKLTKH
jgi:hypothetical protein